MSNGIFRVMLVAAAMSIFAASMVFAADANAPAAPKPAPAPAPAPAPLTVKGTVSVVKDANDVITAVKLTTEGKVVYNVVLDKEGKELGSKMAGKEVEAQVVKQGADVKVVSYKPVEKAAEKPAEKPMQ
jgi:hypothetical protein